MFEATTSALISPQTDVGKAAAQACARSFILKGDRLQLGEACVQRSPATQKTGTLKTPSPEKHVATSKKIS